ncbi:MAG: hypothetical protein ACO3JZ_08250 [Schleiferiaceae bacterium]
MKPQESILSYDRWTLTKSSFVKGRQCAKLLHLYTFKRNEQTPVSKELQKVFDRGHSFEDYVRENGFPGGVNVKDEVSKFGYLNSYTKRVLSEPGSKVLYEATFIEDEVLVMCDILTKDSDGFIDVYEIKLNRNLNEAIWNDLAIQFTICKKRFGGALRSFNAILRDDESGQHWTEIDMTEQLDLKVNQVQDQIVEFKNILENQEPEINMGEHCNKPYACAFKEYCTGLKRSV